MASAKIFSLFVRTLSKPVAGYIKNQAHQHDGFKQVCIGLGQGMYKTETMMRLNLLMTPAQRENERKKIEAEEAKKRAREEEQKQKEKEAAYEKAREEALAKGEDPPEPPQPPPKPKEGDGATEPPAPKKSWRIRMPFFFTLSHSPLMAAYRPLTATKALERGAQTFSELFIFSVAAALILAETYRGSRNRRKEKTATEERIDELTEVVRLLASQLDQLEAHRSQSSTTIAKRLANALSGDAPASDRRPLFDFDALAAEAKRRVAQAEAEAEAAEKEAEERAKRLGLSFGSKLSGPADSPSSSSTGADEPSTSPSTSGASGPHSSSNVPVAAASPLEFMEAENESLRQTVAALLRLAMQNGLMERDLNMQTAPSSGPTPEASVEGPAPSPVFPLKKSLQRGEDDFTSQRERIAAARARAIAQEVRADMVGPESGEETRSLTDLLGRWTIPRAAESA